MRKLLVLSAFLAGACAASQAPIPVRGDVAGHICNADGGKSFIGQPVTDETGATILRATNSAVLRWAPPGAMLTMDYSESRVTVHTDAANKVSDVKCG
jgi:hypothetical protein